MYVVEIPFRILSSINLLTLSRWAIALNPPAWSWGLDAPNTIPMNFSVFVTIKQAAVGFALLLFADALLNNRYARRFFKLREYTNNKKTSSIISAFLSVGFLFWLLDSVFYSFVFYQDSSLIDLLALDIPNYNVFTRIVFVVFCLICGLITSRILRAQSEGQLALEEREEELRQIIQGYSIPTFVIDNRHEVTHWNEAAENLTGITAEEMIGTKNQWKPFYSEERPVMADIVVNGLPDNETRGYHLDGFGRSSVTEGTIEAEDFFPNMGEDGRWLLFSATPLKALNGDIIGAIETIQDMTDRKQAEEVLQESETRHKNLYSMMRLMSDNLPDLIWAKDMESRFLFVNKACSEILLDARDTDEPIGKTDMYFAQRRIDSHPENPDYFTFGKMCADSDQAVLDTKKPLRFDESGNVRGELLFLDVHKAPFEDEDGTLIGTVGCARIVTKQRQMERELQEREEKYRLLADNSIDVIWQTDLKLVFTYVSPSVSKTFGYSVEEWVGTRLSQHAGAEDFSGIEETALHAIEHYKDFEYLTFDAVMLRKDGTEIPVEITGRLLLDKKGFPIGLQGTTRDITERKRAEEERERLMSAIAQAAEAVVITDSEGTIQYVNPAFERVTRYTREEAIGRNPRILKSGEHDAAFYKEMWETLTRGEAWSGHFTNRRKDGTLYAEESVISPVRDASGRTVNYVAVKRDITEEMKLQEQYRQAQKMESVGRLAGGVAHDFNNMLGVILGHTELAMDQMDPAGPLFPNLQEIRKAAERSADLTRQLLAFARKQTIAPKVLDLNETIEGMLKMLRRLIGEDIDLAWLPKAGIWQVMVDPSQIDQVLANLCVNARDAITDVGKVTIETGNATFDEAYCDDHLGSVPGEYLLLAVSDDGCGMDKETLGKLFEPFFTTKETGTGLGLSTVYGVVKQNNGFINVYSEPGDGTTFKLYLPRYAGVAEQVRTEGSAEPADRGHETILLVEDEPAILKLATTMLERQGYTVLAASMPGEAIRLAAEHTGKIHLLMTDVVMPEMNGRELAKNLLSLYPDLKRLFMSGYTADVIAHRGVIDEGVNFIQKPFTMQDLAAKVRQVLNGK